MNVLVSINRGYLRFFYVMLNSLCLNTGQGLSVFVMHDDLTEGDTDMIKKAFPMVRFSFIFMDGEFCRGFPTVKRYPQTIYYRIFAPALLPDSLDRVLYLDCDLIVHNNIDDFYSTEFDGNYFIACSNTGKFLTWFNQLRLSVGREYAYMNTGVVLMNLKELRGVLDVEAIKQYTIKNKWRLMLYDQDVLCKFYGNKIKIVDGLKFNLSDRRITKHNLTHRNKIDGEWVKKNNVIIHYIGYNKPWKEKYKGMLATYFTDAEKNFNQRVMK